MWLHGGSHRKDTLNKFSADLESMAAANEREQAANEAQRAALQKVLEGACGVGLSCV